MFTIGFGLACLALAFMVGAGLLVRYAKLPPWTHRDLLAFTALIGTIGGAMVLTILKWQQVESFNAQSNRLITELVTERKGTLSDSVGSALETIIGGLTWDLKLTSAGILVVLLSLGLVISARTIKGKIFGNELEMNTGGAAEGARATADAANAKAEEIADAVDEVDAAPR